MPNHTQSNSSKLIKKLPVFETEKELTKFLENSFTDSLKQLIRVTVKVMIKAEMEQFRKELLAEAATAFKLYFNGHYQRNMTSSFGEVKNIPVPRFRDNPNGFTPQTLSVFDSEQEKFSKLVEQMHLMGISQRKVKKLVKTCLGVNISVNRVGEVHKQLADQEELNINTQTLDDNFEYLIADGLWTKTKGYGWETNKSVLLCVLGIRPDKTRKIIGFKVARSESYRNWHQLLTSVKKRGLKGKQLSLCIADGETGLHSAVKNLYPSLPIQLCVVHKIRGVIGNTKRKYKAAIGEDVSLVFKQTTKDKALKEAKKFCKKWYLKEPTAISSFRHNLGCCFTYLEFPKHKWSKIRSTNILEREFREIRRRIKVFDSSFNDINSHNRYANTIINYLNQNYPAYQNPKLHTNG
jgi:putative transposase